MNEPQAVSKKPLITALFVIAGFCYAGVVGLLSAFMAGAGHGWGSASISWAGLVLVPLATVAWSYRRTRAGRVLAVITLVGGAFIDISLFIETRSEGFGYIERVWSVMPVSLLAWFVLWLAWQFALASVIFNRVASLCR